jgi:hypothetical protein
MVQAEEARTKHRNLWISPLLVHKLTQAHRFEDGGEDAQLRVHAIAQAPTARNRTMSAM